MRMVHSEELRGKMIERLATSLNKFQEDVNEKLGREVDIDKLMSKYGLKVVFDLPEWNKEDNIFEMKNDGSIVVTPTSFSINVVKSDDPSELVNVNFCWGGANRWQTYSRGDLIILLRLLREAKKATKSVWDIINGNSPTIDMPAADGTVMQVKITDLMKIAQFMGTDSKLLEKTERFDAIYMNGGGKTCAYMVKGNIDRKSLRTKLTLGCEAFDVDGNEFEAWFDNMIELIEKAINSFNKAVEMIEFVDAYVYEDGDGYDWLYEELENEKKAEEEQQEEEQQEEVV